MTKGALNIDSRYHKNLVIKSNSLINSRYKLTLAEMRIILYAISQIEPHDKNFKPYRIYIKDIMEYVGTKSKNEYERAKEVTEKLRQRTLTIPTERGLVQTGWIVRAEYFHGKGFVEVMVDPALKPYLLELKQQFTQYHIRNVLSLRSSHSIRMYELLKQYEKIGTRVLEISEIKSLLGLEKKYKRNYNIFKKKVILQAKKDLEEFTDIYFDFEELKKGKKIVAIKFIIHSKIKKEEKVLDPLKQLNFVQNDDNFGLKERIKEFGFTEKQALQKINQYDEDYINENLDIVEEHIKKGNVSKITAYANKALETDFRPVETKFDKTIYKKEKQSRPKLSEDEKRKKILSYFYSLSDEKRKNLIQFLENDPSYKIYFLDEKNDIENAVIDYISAHKKEVLYK